MNQKTSLPNDIRVTISDDQIRVSNPAAGAGYPLYPDPEKVWAKCGGQVRFMIRNDTKEEQAVAIPLNRIEPHGAFKPKNREDRRPQKPLRGHDIVVVPAGGEKGIVFTVMPKSYFPFGEAPWEGDPAMGMTYKYTIYANEHMLDPDIEIRP
jgi:hypothetical protein